MHIQDFSFRLDKMKKNACLQCLNDNTVTVLFVLRKTHTNIHKFGIVCCYSLTSEKISVQTNTPANAYHMIIDVPWACTSRREREAEVMLLSFGKNYRGRKAMAKSKAEHFFA